jgi:hypothetical protein
MRSTVLAGAIEFSPADIAAILAVIVGLFLVVTAPGWLTLGWAAARQARRHGRRPWVAAVGGGAAGIAVSVAVSGAAGVLIGEAGGIYVAGPVAVLTSWALCGLLARRLAVGPHTS